MRRFLLLGALLLSLAAPAWAQQTVAGAGGTGGTGSAATTDPDDASIAVGQTNDNVNALNMGFDGSVWKRVTFGTAGSPSAQVTTIQGITSGTPVIVGDGSGALNVICDSGCSGGGTGLLTSDPDDASIAAGQTNSNVNNLSQAFDGSVWRRMTFGTAGTASTQVWTMQGISGGTPVIVGDGSGALNVICDSGCSGSGSTLTSDPDDASIAAAQTNSNVNGLNQAFDGTVWRRMTFGTAGTASAQVWSMQGIASGTPLRVDFAQVLGSTHSATNPVFTRAVNSTGAIADDVADDAAISGGPASVPIGCKVGGISAMPTAMSADADKVTVFCGSKGQVMTQRTDGTNVEALDPCKTVAKVTDTFRLTARGVIVAKTASKKTSICAISINVAGTAEIGSILEGDGTTCQSNTVALMGNTTAANGNSYAANGGQNWGNGDATVIQGKTNNLDVCWVPSGSNPVNVTVTWVQR